MSGAIPRLGFGCSGLMARLGRSQSLRLLETAFDNGITHFDVARMYGYGAAESVVGDLIASRRPLVTVTTKAGILPPRRSRLMPAVRTIARNLATIHPSIQTRLRHRAEAMSSHGRFDIGTLCASVRTSLAELRTDYIDFLLLHDCAFADLANPELLTFLDGLQRDGMVRRFGIATSFEVARAARDAYPPLTELVQFSNNPWKDHLATVQWPTPTTVFTHSGLGAPFLATWRFLSNNPIIAKHWNDRLGIDCTDRDVLGTAFLSAALAANETGCVLFSSQRIEAITRNARVRARPELRAALNELVHDLAKGAKA